MLKAAAVATGGSRVLARAPLPPAPPPASSPGVRHLASRLFTRRHASSAAKASDTAAAATQDSADELSSSPSQGQPASLAGLPHFAGLPLDRIGALRKEQDQLDQLLDAPSSLVVLMNHHRLLAAPAPEAEPSSSSSSAAGSALALHPHSFAASGATAPDGGQPRWLPLVTSTQQLRAAMPAGLQQQVDFIFLGLDAQGSAVFAVQAPQHLQHLLPKVPAPRSNSKNGSGSDAGAPSGQPAPAVGAWVDVRREGQNMTGGDAAVAALAAGLVQWHGSALFCGRTGAKTQVASGGHSRSPEASPGKRPRSVYPRIDPAVIVAVSCGDWLLLGRKASWDAGRYSCLAGFAEVGETLEQAVGREVMEESGVAVDLASVRYHSSQPWPFPQSLMIGFMAEAAAAAPPPAPAQQLSGDGNAQAAAALARHGLALLSGPAVFAAREVGLLPAEAERYLLPQLPPIQVDPEELEDARWFHADWLAAAVRGGAPPAASRGAPPCDFCIPGRYALASAIITSWLRDVRQRRRREAAGASADAAAAAAALVVVPDVLIDEGSFKYVLLRLSSPDGLHSKLLVRGDSRAAYHNHVLQATAAEVRAAAPGAGLLLGTVGGGRIEHYTQQRAVAVYGFSSAFGQAPHDVTAALLRRWLPLHDITVSYQGY